MPHHDLRRPMADVRSFLAQIDNAVDPGAREPGGMAGSSRRSHPETWDNTNRVRSAAKHLPYNGGTLASGGCGEVR
jgi:hypothetical protein